MDRQNQEGLEAFAGDPRPVSYTALAASHHFGSLSACVADG